MAPEEVEALPVIEVTSNEARAHRRDPGFVSLPHYCGPGPGGRVTMLAGEIGHDETARYALR